MTKSFSDAKYKNPEKEKAIVGWSGQDYKPSRTGRKQRVDMREGTGARPNVGQEKYIGAE